MKKIAIGPNFKGQSGNREKDHFCFRPNDISRVVISIFGDKLLLKTKGLS